MTISDDTLNDVVVGRRSTAERRRSSLYRLSNRLLTASDGDMEQASSRALSLASSVGRRSISGSRRFSNSGLRRRASIIVAFKPQDDEPEKQDEGISPFLASVLTANYISIGFLFVPYAFATTGLLLTAVIFGLVMLQSFVTSTFVMEACTRAELLACLHDERSSLTAGPLRNNNIPNIEESDEEETGTNDKESDDSDSHGVHWHETIMISTPKLSQPLPEKQVELPAIANRKFELPELCRIFMGDTWKAIFTLTTCCDLYGLTWSVASVFASSLATEFSWRQNKDDYILFAAVFACIVAPLSFIPIVEQLYVQVAFFVGRMIMVFLMLVTAVAAFFSSEPHFGDQQDAQSTASLANFGALHTAAQICIFSTAFQFSVPVIASAALDKTSVRSIYGRSTSFIAVSVSVLSLVLASYFGKDLMEKSVNLNWSVYHGGSSLIDEETGSVVGVAWWANVISKFVVVYPAVDGISTFVLCAVSLSEILMGAWYADRIHEIEDDWKRRLFFCLMGSCPQIVGSIFVRDLSVIATYAGLFTVASYSICPCLLQIYSSRIVAHEGLTTRTMYETLFSNEVSAWIVACLGLSLIFYAVIGSSVLS